MIITCCIGGLGNQMFQYAMGLALAERLETELRLDIRLFDGYELHNGFELERVFAADVPIASDDDIRSVMGWRTTRLGRRLLSYRQLSFLKGRHYYSENGLAYNEAVRSLPKDCYLYGYWQSERYFEAHEALIRDHFRFKLPLSGENRAISHRIASSTGAVSLHVRRGDYVTNAHTNAVHGTCTTDYYAKAMRYIEERIENPFYVVFSDDVEWARANIRIDREHCFVDFNHGSESYNDMRLMSMCGHHIIANSSFSWWGAWLNPNRDKIVIAPDQWFLNPDWDSRDHVPARWIRL